MVKKMDVGLPRNPDWVKKRKKDKNYPWTTVKPIKNIGFITILGKLGENEIVFRRKDLTFIHRDEKINEIQIIKNDEKGSDIQGIEMDRAEEGDFLSIWFERPISCNIGIAEKDVYPTPLWPWMEHKEKHTLHYMAQTKIKANYPFKLLICREE